ncbi:hypothetical protein HDV00_006996 [Rhizophlyctis rosea]|nr:hypothetical protein HDV00_006996 [Rhizophlyctis rosea]
MADHAHHPAADNSDINFIPAEEVASLLKDPSKVAGRDYRIIDVREPSSYSKAHIPSAVNIVKAQIESDPTVVQQQQSVHKLIFHCGVSQNRGPEAARAYIKAAGDDIRQEILVLEGGFLGWEGKGLDVQK